MSNCVQRYKMMSINMDFSFIDALTHSTDEQDARLRTDQIADGSPLSGR